MSLEFQRPARSPGLQDCHRKIPVRPASPLRIHRADERPCDADANLSFLSTGAIMPQTFKTPSIAIVLSGGDVLSVIIQEWPDSIPMPLAAIVDCDIQGVAEENLTHILVDKIPMVAVCRFEVPESYEDVKIKPSPKEILATFGQFVDSGD
jgi:hypothetical protein